MIQAFLDSTEIKLFPETAIGITIENFNISDISNRKIDRTNTLKIPKAGNEDIFEFSSIPNAPTDFAYTDYDFDMIVDGIQIYDNGRAFIVGEDDNSYTINITNNKNIIDLLKSISLADLYSGDTVTLVNTTTWQNLFKQPTNGFKIDHLFDSFDPTQDEFAFAAGLDYISIYVSTILTKIAADYSITFSGNLLTETDFIELRVPCVASNLKRDNGSVDIYVDDLVIHDSLNAWDLLKNVLQLFCGVFKIVGTNMELQKFDDIDSTTPVDWSGKLVSKSKRFAIPNVSQKNYIKYSVEKEVDALAYGGSIDCNNENIDFEKDLIKMKAKIFVERDIESNDSGSVLYTGASTAPLFVPQMPDASTRFNGLPTDPTPERVKGMKDLVFFVDSAEYLGAGIQQRLQYYYETAPPNWTNPILSGAAAANADTEVVKFYDPTGNYTLIETMLTDPVLYEAELLLNVIDIYQFDHFKAVKIDELEGVFYVNKISNFLATSPGTPTKVELIKIS